MEYRKIVSRLAVELSMTEQESDVILSEKSSDADARAAMETIIRERRFRIVGGDTLDSYVPADIVSAFNETYGTDYGNSDVELLISDDADESTNAGDGNGDGYLLSKEEAEMIADSAMHLAPNEESYLPFTVYEKAGNADEAFVHVSIRRQEGDEMLGERFTVYINDRSDGEMTNLESVDVAYDKEALVQKLLEIAQKSAAEDNDD